MPDVSKITSRPQPPAEDSFVAVADELDRRRRVTMGLERVTDLLHLLGDPQHDLRVAQVVGTNGKGTTAVALAAALDVAGHPSGAYLSPHVLSYTERAMVRGRYVTEDIFAATMNRAIRGSDAGGAEASQFELLTAGAIRLFAEEGLTWAVLEAGLGARHDATSAARPEAVVLTNVGLDHAEYLGNTVEEVAREKLASLREGSILILGTEDPRVAKLARERCGRIGARLIEAGDAASEARAPGLPPYAARDVALGVRAAEVLMGRELSIGERALVGNAVAGALPGRFEVHGVGGVPVVVDGAHNPSGVRAVLAAMGDAYGERPLGVVFGVLRDKDVGSMLTALEGEARFLALTRAEGARAADPARVLHEHGPRDRTGRQATLIEDPTEALNAAVRDVEGLDGVVLVTGSLNTAAPVLRWLRER